MLTLHLMPATPRAGPASACAEIRLLRPYRHPSVDSLASVSVAERLPSWRLDAVVMQREGPGGASLQDLVALLRQLRARGLPLVYDLDDDLLETHPTPEVEAAMAVQRPKVRLLLREARVVTVPTAELARRVRPINPNVEIWPNALDERLIEPLRQDRPSGADLGYFGTTSHLEDLLSVLPGLRQGLAVRGGTTSVELCGVSDFRQLAGAFGPFASAALRPMDGDYAAFMRGFQQGPAWRVGLAPLADNPFNAAKSDVKFLDYAAFGVPAVYAAGPVYREVQDGRTGLTADAGGWGAAVVRLLEDGELARSIAIEAREHLMQNRTLERRAGELISIVEAALAGEAGFSRTG